MSAKKWQVTLLGIVLSLAGAQLCWAQSADLSGVIRDESGGVIPNAEVSAVNETTGTVRSTTSNQQGVYTFPALGPSVYKIIVSAPGFQAVARAGVVLNAADRVVLDFVLEIARLETEVTITATAPLLQKTATVGTTVDRQFVENLPLNGRSFQSLILLTPGVVASRADDSNPGQFSVNGQRTNANYFTVDGVSANIGVNASAVGSYFAATAGGAVPGLTAFGGTNGLVSIDALEEFKIQTSTYSAEFGRQPGGQVTLVTRSGTNRFQGTLFDYIRNDAFDARNWFDNAYNRPKAALRQNQFGGTLGGPVQLPGYDGRNRTFFFFSYEGQRLRLPSSVDTRVPSLDLRNNAPDAIKPILNAFPLPTDSELMIAGQPSGAAPYRVGFSKPSRMDTTSIRIDHTFANRLNLFARYNDSPSKNLTRSLSVLTGSSVHTRTLTLGGTLTVTPNMTNEFRFNFSHNRGRTIREMDDFGGAVPVDPSVFVSGYTGSGGPVYGSFYYSASGASFSIAMGDSSDSYQRQLNLVDNVTWVRGTHQFRFGMDLRLMFPVYGPTEYSQSVYFNTRNDVLSGVANTFRVYAYQGARMRMHNYSFYAQDTWRLSPRMTLDYGLRWDLNPAPREKSGMKPLLVVGADNMATARLTRPDEPFYRTFYGAFAPRTGLSYQLSQASGRETVLQGGFGVYYDIGSGTSTAGYDTYPFSSTSVVNNIPFPIPASYVVRPTFPEPSLPTTQPLFALNMDLGLPYTLQWNAGVQQSLGARQTLNVSYVGSAGRNLLIRYMVNNRIGNPSTGPRPNPDFGSVTYTTNGGTSDYHSLQVRYQARLPWGLQAMINYTLGHAMDEVSNEMDQGTLERASADFDVRHNFSAALTFDVPSLDGRGALDSAFGSVVKAVANNWSIDATIQAQSGTPLDIFAGNWYRDDGTWVRVRPDVVPGQPFWVEDPTAPGGKKLNLDAFARPPFIEGSTVYYARQGTLGRNVVRQPGRYQVNMALRRRIPLAGSANLQLRVEAFNVFNMPVFASYNTSYAPGSATFGKATNTLNSYLGGLNALYQIGGPRSIQLGIRLSF